MALPSRPPVSRRRALAWAAEELRRAGVEEAPLDAELLLRHALALSPVDLWRDPLRPLGEGEWQAYRALVARRARREPAAYITGRRHFFGLELRVDRSVLVPRPETEHLVEAALEWARRREPQRGADVGTGSGAVALALARALPGLEVWAIDPSQAALRVARENARRLGLEGRVHFLCARLLEPVGATVELIAANLPYVPADQWEQLPPEVREHEPREALVPGPRGSEAIEALLRQAPQRLAPGGALFLEVGFGQHEQLARQAAAALPGARIRVLPDLAGRPRVIAAEIEA